MKLLLLLKGTLLLSISTVFAQCDDYQSSRSDVQLNGDGTYNYA